MPPSDIAHADLDDIVEKLTQEEAILLTAGVGFWHTHAVPRLNIPAIKVRPTCKRSLTSFVLTMTPPGQRRPEWDPR